jgi:hypothetical protein
MTNVPMQHLLVHTTDGSVWNTKQSVEDVVAFVEAVQLEDTTVGLSLDDETLYHIYTANIVCIEIKDFVLVPRWKAALGLPRKFWRWLWYV